MRAPKEKEPQAEALSQLLDINEAITQFFKSNSLVGDSIEKALAAQAAKALPDNKGEL